MTARRVGGTSPLALVLGAGRRWPSPTPDRAPDRDQPDQGRARQGRRLRRTASSGSSRSAPTRGPARTCRTGDTDAIQLVGLDFDDRRGGRHRHPPGLVARDPRPRARPDQHRHAAGRRPDLTAEVVAELVGIHARLRVRRRLRRVPRHGRHHRRRRRSSPTARSPTTSSTSTCVEGSTEFDGAEAPRLRPDPRRCRPATSTGSANQQQLMLGILARPAGRRGRARVHRARQPCRPSPASTPTSSPTELYRLAQAITLIRPDRVETCVLTGATGPTSRVPQVVVLDEAQARRIGADAATTCASTTAAEGLATPSPASRAMMIAWARWATWSLAKMLLAWLRTVLTDSPSSRAISAFSSPSAISAEDHPLAIGELRGRRRTSAGSAGPGSSHHPVGDARPEDDLAGPDRLDRRARSRRAGRP